MSVARAVTMVQTIAVLSFLMCNLDCSLGFTARTPLSHQRMALSVPTKYQQQPISPLKVAFSSEELFQHHYDSQDEARNLMDQARECAYSDGCSLDDVRGYLQEVVFQVQSDCVTGDLVSDDLCDNQDVVADIVSRLRTKLEPSANEEQLTIAAAATTTGVLKEGVSKSAKIVEMVLVAVALIGVSVAISSTMALYQPDVTPFKLQEWWWAIRDGYFFTLLDYWYRHGGLLVDSASYYQSDDAVVPFTAQEWWWAMHGGYLNLMLDSFFQNGGLLVSSSSVVNNNDMVVSPTTQEWVWAMQGGYFDTMMQHVFTNGGLETTSEGVTSSAPFTPREWIWAFQGGYLDTMIQHYIRNGGI